MKTLHPRGFLHSKKLKWEYRIYTAAPFQRSSSQSVEQENSVAVI